MGLPSCLSEEAIEATRQLDHLSTTGRRCCLSLHRGHPDPRAICQASELSSEDTATSRRAAGHKVSPTCSYLVVQPPGL